MPAQPPARSDLDPGNGPGHPIDAAYPNGARIWNYQLGGKDNFRRVAETPFNIVFEARR